MIGDADGEHEWKDVRNRINEIIARPACPLCRQDLENSGLFRLFSDLLEYWDGPHNKWVETYNSLKISLRERLEVTKETRKILLDRVRFTHDSISRRFRQSRTTPEDEAMVLDVVYHHGHYRSLNNRHLDAQKQAQERLPSWIQAEYRAWVRIWPLTPGMRIHGKDVVDKFYEASSSRNNGRSVSRGRRGH